MKDLTLPPLPEIPKSEIIPYSAIRYVAGYTESFVHKYAQDYARAALASHHADAQPKTAKCQSCKGTGFDKLATPEQKWPWCEKCSGSGKLPIKCAALSNHEDGGRAATDKDSLTTAPVVALGGEKGEAVAEVVSKFGDPEAFGEREVRVLADLSKIPYDTKLFAAPVGKARMLTDEEADHITGMHNTGRAQGDSECAEAIQRKFCEVNGISLAISSGDGGRNG